MHSAREAYIKCESYEILKAALKKKVFACGDKSKFWRWDLFKNKSRSWEGPVKIVSKDEKL